MPGRRPAWTRSSSRYDAARRDGKAVGIGLGLKNSGLGNGFMEIAKAVVRFHRDGQVEVRHCWTEMGQGVHTVALQVAVQELGVDPDAGRRDGRHQPRARAGPDDREPGHAYGRRRGAPTRAGPPLTAVASPRSTTWASTASTGRTTSARSTTR